MSQQPQMNMASMGGAVGGGAPGPAMNVGTPGATGSQEAMIKLLNTAIYDYLLRNSMYDVARSFVKSVEIEVADVKQSPNQRNGQVNGAEDSMDADSKDPGILQRPDDLPAPTVLGCGGPFLQDWWCQFWEIFNGHRQRASRPSTVAYLHQARQNHKARISMMGSNMDPNSMQNIRGYNNMMQGMNNGMMQGDLKRAAMQNQQGRNLTPAQMQQVKNMQSAQQNSQLMSGNQMERQGSQIDMSGPRSGSPGSGDAPSPKRQRLEGGMQPGRPGQPGQMQGNQVGPQPDFPPPDPAQLQQARELLIERGHNPDQNPTGAIRLAERRRDIQTQAADVYSKSLKQQMQHAMMNNTSSNMNKGMPPNMGPGGAQGSPMSQTGMDGQTGEFYAATNRNGQVPMPSGPNGPGAANQGNGNGNHALQDYQMQLMLLEQQNKKRLLMARQEQDSMAHPAGVAPNGQFPPGMSPQGSQRGGDPSPNPNEMQRGRGSPVPGMIDPNQIPANLRTQMMMPNGQQLRPPSSHPGAMGQLQQQQMETMRHQMGNGVFPPGAQPPPGQMMPGQQPGPGGQPGQGQPMGTPRQQPNNMGPPPAPANASGTNPSSPAQPPAPPTPQQGNKQKPGTKEAKKKAAAAKKNNSQTGATPATDSEQPPTPTPPTPITPMNQASFNATKHQQLPNGGPQATSQPNNVQANNAQQQQHQSQQPGAVQQPQQVQPDISVPFGNLGDGDFSMNLEFGPLEGSDVLDNFDFDSFLNPDGGDGLNFDAQFAFGDTGLEAGLDAPN